MTQLTRRLTAWTGALFVAAAMAAVLFAALPAGQAAAETNLPTPEPTPPMVAYISTWGSGQIGTIKPTPTPREATAVLTYTGADILRYSEVPDRAVGVWTKYFDGVAAGLNPTGQWKHNINAIWISDTVSGRYGVNSGEFIAAFTQDQQKGIPGIDGWVDGYDLVYWNGYSFTLWFDGEDVGLNHKTQEKIDALDIMPTAPISSTFAEETCEAYIAISTQGRGFVPAPELDGRRKPVVKFRGEDVLGFCATNLGTNTTGYWEMLIDASELEWTGPGQRIPTRFTDSISWSHDPLNQGAYVMANRKLPYHSLLFGFDTISGTVTSPIESFAQMGITSPVDALHLMDYANR